MLFQVKRLELLLAKCKDSIKSNKERNHTLMAEKEELLQKLNNKEEENRKLKVGLLCGYFCYACLSDIYKIHDHC